MIKNPDLIFFSTCPDGDPAESQNVLPRYQLSLGTNYHWVPIITGYQLSLGTNYHRLSLGTNYQWVPIIAGYQLLPGTNYHISVMTPKCFESLLLCIFFFIHYINSFTLLGLKCYFCSSYTRFEFCLVIIGTQQ